MAKRANHEGSIFKRKRDGLWVGRISLGRHPQTGKRLMETVYGSSQKEVREKLEQLKGKRTQVRRGKLVNETLAAYLQRWLEEAVRLEKARATFTEYELSIRRYVVPFLGTIPLTKLEPTHVQTWQSDMRYLRGSNFDRRCWYPIREDAGISDSVTFHDLRHTAASLLIAAGVDITTVQQRLGHTKASTTLDTYAHMMPDSQANAVARVDALLAESASANGTPVTRAGDRRQVPPELPQ